MQTSRNRMDMARFEDSFGAWLVDWVAGSFIMFLRIGECEAHIGIALALYEDAYGKNIKSCKKCKDNEH